MLESANSSPIPPLELPLDLCCVIVGDVGRRNLARAEASLGQLAHKTPDGPVWAAFQIPKDDAEVRVFSISRHLAELIKGTHQQTAYLDGQLTEVLLTDEFYLMPNIVLKVMDMTPYATAAGVIRPAGSLWPDLPPKWADAIYKDHFTIPQGISHVSHVLIH